jgi:hypothetical protein
MFPKELNEDLRQPAILRQRTVPLLAGAGPWAVVAGDFSFGRNEEDIRTLAGMGV